MGRHSPEYVHAHLMEDMGRSNCIRQLAALIVLGRTGTEFDPGVVESVAADVVAVAEEYDASPDEVQGALEDYEQTLKLTHSYFDHIRLEES